MPARYIVVVLLVSYASAKTSSCPADASNHGSCRGDIPLGDVTSLVQKRHLSMNERRQEEHNPVQEKKNELVQEDEHESEEASGQHSALCCTEHRYGQNTKCKNVNQAAWPWLKGGDDLHTRCMVFCIGKSSKIRGIRDNIFYSVGYSGDCYCCGDNFWEQDERSNIDTWRCEAAPVDCEMSDWSDWDICSSSCGDSDATHSRSREVRKKETCGGKCGELAETKPCGQNECPVDCELGEWKDWSACSVSCGEGERTRSRRIAVEEEHGGRKCDEPDTKASEACKEPECPVDCELGEWEDWSACSVKCGQGERTRVQSVAVMEEHGGRTCDPEKASEACKEAECPVDPPVDPLVEPLVEPQSDVCGLVKNAATASPLDGVKVKIGELVTETDEKGKYCFMSPAPGTVEVTAEKEGWFDYKAKAAITNGMTSFDDIVIAQVLAPREWQIILEWKDNPKDLDAITTFGDLSGDCQVDRTHHVSEHCKNGMTAAVDHDNSDTEDQVDAESTTIKGVDPNKCGSGCMIYFRVQNYLADKTRTVRDDGTLSYKSLPLVDTKAIVRVLNENGEVRRFEAVNANSTHTDKYNGDGENGIIHDAHWYVFRIDAKSGEVVPCEKSQLECV